MVKQALYQSVIGENVNAEDFVKTLPSEVAIEEIALRGFSKNRTHRIDVKPKFKENGVKSIIEIAPKTQVNIYLNSGFVAKCRIDRVLKDVYEKYGIPPHSFMVDKVTLTCNKHKATYERIVKNIEGKNKKLKRTKFLGLTKDYGVPYGQNDVCDTVGTHKTICEARTEQNQIWVCKTVK